MFLATQLRKTHVQFSRKLSSKPTEDLNLRTCIALLQSCAQNQELGKGRKIHSRMLVSGHLGSPPSATSLINMYSKCNSIADAVSVFRMSTNVHNVFVYNSLIAGLTVNGLPNEAFEFYCKMRLFGVAPDKFTFPCSALLHSYLEFELMGDALEVFEGLPSKDDVVLWNAMINGYVQIGGFDKALVIFRRMADNGPIPNRFTVTGVLSALALAGEVHDGMLVHAFAIKMGYDTGVAVLNALIDMYGKCRQLADALVVFENMMDKDMYSWNSIISVHEQCGDHDGTLGLLKVMVSSGFQPDLVTVTATLPACSSLAALMHGREVHGYMIINGLNNAGNTYTDNAIMDMYTKCGSMREARLVFDKMKIKDVASWNIMVMGYGMHGFGKESLNLFSRMCESGLKPDEVSFVGVLAACSHAGLVSQGRELLAEMQPLYGVTPAIEHYACVIDMLGRAGKLEEAFELVSNMSIKPNQVVWRALLAACRLHGNADLAEVAAQRVLELEPEHCGNYVLMSNIYGAAGRYEQVAELRHTMRQQDVKKSPGCSWIELSDGMHAFLNGDRSHPEEHYLYDGLDSLTACLRERGWIDRFEIPIFWFHFIINEISCCENKVIPVINLYIPFSASVDDISSDNIKKWTDDVTNEQMHTTSTIYNLENALIKTCFVWKMFMSLLPDRLVHK
ncbi:UNVERIFIED_CONTAM: Pentatricopeptide repeat-containing protein [Sesamum angustifolium]|uniref:Pentatricopeptide repeat-containing protein n=1 Tax=Sesamum angustifolium TaxID=2727405 RepID=A0AAW2JA90_9LAMI